MKISRIQLVRIRAMYRLTMSEMAEELDVTSSYINRLEKGHDAMSPVIHERIVEVFGLNANKMRSITRAYNTYKLPTKADKEAE